MKFFNYLSPCAEVLFLNFYLPLCFHKILYDRVNEIGMKSASVITIIGVSLKEIFWLLSTSKMIYIESKFPFINNVAKFHLRFEQNPRMTFCNKFLGVNFISYRFISFPD